jgi:hypothetical protein
MRLGVDSHANVVRWRVVKAQAGGFCGFAGFPPVGSADETRDAASDPTATNPQNPQNPQPEYSTSQHPERWGEL